MKSINPDDFKVVDKIKLSNYNQFRNYASDEKKKIN
jgi:hypothetical protein